MTFGILRKNLNIATDHGETSDILAPSRDDLIVVVNGESFNLVRLLGFAYCD